MTHQADTMYLLLLRKATNDSQRWHKVSTATVFEITTEKLFIINYSSKMSNKSS